MQALLEKLQLSDMNDGACDGRWLNDNAAEAIVSYNPTTGEPIAAVRQATAVQIEQTITAAQEAFADWRMTPAPGAAN
jgi:acyl-CoA reductase-like NAD-dependent aldehyde dehydrogenase